MLQDKDTTGSLSGGWEEPRATAVLVLQDGTVLEGFGIGATGEATGEVCFNTSMTGYQEILTDPSYAGQIITFTFPHIGNVGTNEEDIESVNAASSSGVRGVVLAAAITEPSNWRASRDLDAWLKARSIVGLTGIDTRALTTLIRDRGMPNAVIAHDPEGRFDLEALKARAAALPAMDGLDLVPLVTSTQRFGWDETPWHRGEGYGHQTGEARRHVVAIDYGVKRNILRLLARAGCKITVVPATATAEDVLALKPDGVFLSNGPGDPAALDRAVGALRPALGEVPVFGICLGHQLLGLALGCETYKMPFGHHGANHPVRNLENGRIEITSQNHGFAVLEGSLPEGVDLTHRNLYDGTVEGLSAPDLRAWSVQYHPESSPGPRDSGYLFDGFIDSVSPKAVVG